MFLKKYVVLWNMSQIIALDYGKKRIGIAYTDDLQLIASGLTTIETSKIHLFLREYFVENQVENIVIGEPKTLSGDLNEVENDILKLIEKIKKDYPELKIHRVDERFTSKIAAHTISQSGMNKKKRQNKSLLDEISATLILQSFLEQKNNKFSL